jgi:putative phosphoribosyl transferase
MSPHKLFRDRASAGRELAEGLAAYRDASPVVLGLPRGGVPVAYEVARALDAPLDVCVVRKIGAPIQPELGIGAVAEENALYVDRDLMRRVGVSDHELTTLVARERAEVEDRARRFRRGAPPVDVRGRTVIVVDDGVATGGTARAALETLRARGAERVVLAVPVGAADSLDALASIADEVVALSSEEAFYAVGLWYDDFRTTTDHDVIELLDRARSERERPARQPLQSERVRTRVDREVGIPLVDGALEGRLTIPPDARGLVIFAHGSGSSRRSPRNQYVARSLEDEGLATLLFDLLTEEEERIDQRTARLRFDIGLLAARLVAATDWAHLDPQTSALDIGYFGASTGAAAALVAAAERPRLVHAVVSRGGRPDLAEGALARVEAPTLLIVGGADPDVLQLNRESLYFLRGEKRLEIVAGATHLFEEPGALELVARSAARWFRDHLGRRALESIA